jgi:TnpA family transposase
MLDYYGNTLSMASEELAKYTERMENSTAVLEHYKSIMDILGQSTDYEALGIILEG